MGDLAGNKEESPPVSVTSYIDPKRDFWGMGYGEMVPRIEMKSRGR